MDGGELDDDGRSDGDARKPGAPERASSSDHLSDHAPDRGSGPAPEGGLLGQTREPLWQALSAGLSTAAAILATIFLASGAVRKEPTSAVLGLAFAGFACAAALAPAWLSAGKLQRTRMFGIALGLAIAAGVVVRGLIALLPSGSDGDASNAEDVLLVTVMNFVGEVPDSDAAQDWAVCQAVSASIRPNPALATLLTGLEVIEHRVLFDIDDLPGHASPLAQILRGLGYETAILGAMSLPKWARRGHANVELVASLPILQRWVSEDSEAPRFAHAHLGKCAAADIIDATSTFIANGGIVVVCGPHEDGGVGLNDRHNRSVPVAGPYDATIWWGIKGGLDVPDVPRSTASVVPTILHKLGVSPMKYVDAPLLDVGSSEFPAVTMVHGERDEVHFLRAAFPACVLSIELTPLGAHPTDDWTLAPELQKHFVYRNEFSVQRDAEASGATDAELFDRLRRWRGNNSAFEAAVAR